MPPLKNKELILHMSPYCESSVSIVFPKTYRLVRLLRRGNIYWDRFWRKKSISIRYGDLLLAICRRRG